MIAHTLRYMLSTFLMTVGIIAAVGAVLILAASLGLFLAHVVYAIRG